MGGVSRASIIFLRKWNPFCSSGKESIATMRWPTNVQSDKRDSKDYFMYYKIKDARGESGGRTSVARSDATQMIKKQALEFHTRSTTPQSVQACRKKCFKLHSGQKILKNVCHTFLVMFVNCNSNTLECCPNFGVLNYWNFFLNFSHCLKCFSIKSTHLMLWKKKNYALYASGRGF